MLIHAHNILWNMIKICKLAWECLCAHNIINMILVYNNNQTVLKLFLSIAFYLLFFAIISYLWGIHSCNVKNNIQGYLIKNAKIESYKGMYKYMSTRKTVYVYIYMYILMLSSFSLSHKCISIALHTLYQIQKLLMPIFIALWHIRWSRSNHQKL